MRRNRYFTTGAKILIAIGFFFLITSAALTLYNNVQPLPQSLSMVVPIGIFAFMMCSIIGSALLWFDTSWVTRLHRQQQPSEPDDNTVVRVVITEGVNGEYFVYGKIGDSVRKAIENDWPFDRSLRNKQWYVLDEKDIDVTEQPYIEVEGTLRVVFD